jgi:hypothetical protein
LVLQKSKRVIARLAEQLPNSPGDVVVVSLSSATLAASDGTHPTLIDGSGIEVSLRPTSTDFSICRS